MSEIALAMPFPPKATADGLDPLKIAGPLKREGSFCAADGLVRGTPKAAEAMDADFH